MRALLLVAIAVALIGSSGARSQDESASERLSRGERMATFDLPPAEDIAVQGGQAVRVYVYGAFSGLLPAVILERPLHGGPRIVVIGGRRDGEGWRRAVMSAAVPDADWTLLFGEGRDAVIAWQTLEAQRAEAVAHPAAKTGAIGDIVICADGQTSIVEFVDGGQVLRGAEHDCEFRELGDFDADLAKEAVSLLPDCARVGGKDVYRGFSRLALCALASGDRASAVSVINAILDGRRDGPARDASPTIVADWRGKPRAVGGKAFRRLWLELSTSIQPHFEIGDVVGAGETHVTVRGRMVYLPAGDGASYQRADCTENWIKTDGRWRLARLKVGSFAPFEMAHDPRRPT